MNEVQHLSIYIQRSPADVYGFASKPENLPRWAGGLARSEVKREEGAWLVDAPFGRVKIRFSASNTLGVMDHDVELASGIVVHNPMRVVANGAGSEFIFSLFRQSNMSDQQFAADKHAVEQDLKTLKSLLESDM